MTDKQLLSLIFAGIAIAAVIAVILLISGRKRHNYILKEAPQPEPERMEMPATVTGLRCGVALVGLKTPKAVREFTVGFDTPQGHLELPVPEELYDAFEEGQHGTLTLVDGQLYSFSLDE